MPLSLARKAIRFELNMWRSLYLWMRRRVSAQRPGDVAVGYAAAISPIIWAFIVLNLIEIPALHIMLPWQKARFLVDLAGVYSLFWMLGLLASIKVHPHLVTGTGLRVRYGASVDFTIPWEAIASAGSRIRSLQGNRTVRFEGSTVRIGVGSQTNIDIVLREPLVLPLPKTGGEPVTAVHIYADDPNAFLAEVKPRLTREAARNGSDQATADPRSRA
jgi:hypothetical protein